MNSAKGSSGAFGSLCTARIALVLATPLDKAVYLLKDAVRVEAELCRDVGIVKGVDVGNLRKVSRQLVPAQSILQRVGGSGDDTEKQWKRVFQLGPSKSTFIVGDLTCDT